MRFKVASFSFLLLITATITQYAASIPASDLITLTVDPGTDHAELSWNCTTNHQIEYFVLDKSVNGADFYSFDTVAYSIDEQSYRVKDENPSHGRSYYRLRSVLMNGEEVVSRIVALNFEKEMPFGFTVFPTPATDQFYLAFHGVEDAKQPISLKILTLRGRTVTTFDITLEEAKHSFSLRSLNAVLNPGPYIIVSTYSGKLSWQKLVIGE